MAENPHNSLVFNMAAGLAAGSGEFGRAIELQRRAVVVDPLNAVNHGNLSHFLAAVGRYDEAIEANRRMSNLSPELQETSDADLAKLYILTGRYQDALAIILQCPASLAQDHGLALVYDAMGRTTEAEGPISRLIAANDTDSAISLAEIYANSGNYDASFERLKSVYDFLDQNTQQMATSDYLIRIAYSPFLRPLHQDERWAEWLMNAQT
jgi:tetratricopeptide (TPR) repeat protein